MRCKGCDYPLWNLSARVCPECGRPFAPSEYDFVPNSVRFCCPDCNQDYYGTGPRGHLIPQEFDCVRCHQHIAMDEMVLLPTEGVREEQTRTDIMPWLERHKIGRIKAWFQTILRTLFEPTRLTRSIPADSGPGQAMWFAVLSNAIFTAIGAAPLVVFMLFAMLSVGGRSGAVGGSAFAILVIPFSVLGALVAYAIAIPIWAAAVHVLLSITGPTQSGYGVTLRSLAYATGANVIVAIPCVGFYLFWISWIWIGISAVLMLRASQGVSAIRALLAVFTLPLILTVALVGLWVFAFSSAMSAVRYQSSAAAASSSVAVMQAQTQQVAAGLLDYYERKGAFPDHALRLVHDNDLSAYALSSGDPALVPVGNTDLARFLLLPTEDEKSLVEALAKKLPADVAAHRLGDYIFTYHGIDPASDSNLWVVIQWPVTTTSSTPAAVGSVFIGTADRGTHRIPAAPFPARLAEQNQLRAAHNLPPLPDPSQITPAKPASASPPSPPPDPAPK